MTPAVLVVDPVAPDAAVIARAADWLRAGRLVAFPTETVYGLGAHALDAAAVRRVFTAKGRPASNPLIVHVADRQQVEMVVADWPAVADRLADRFWPGPLTLVLPKSPAVPAEVTAGGPTVAVRCPAHPVAQALIRAAGVPVAAPSANRSTGLSPTRAEHVLKSLGGCVDLIVDGGPCPGGIESTVIDVTGPVVRVLRPGPVSVPMLEAVVGPVAVGSTGEGAARSPGLMARHYSPRTPLRLIDPREREAVTAALARAGRRFVVCDLPAEPTAAAAVLYDTLHRLDESGAELILVPWPPEGPEWAAVRDRLARAAAPPADEAQGA